jgi:hypothetical protein
VFYDKLMEAVNRGFEILPVISLEGLNRHLSSRKALFQTSSKRLAD